MKRYGNLYPQIVDFQNLLTASKKAQKGKKYQPNVMRFNVNLEKNLLLLQKQLREKTYQPGKYTSFYITEPKYRQISAAPYRDRVIHHGLCNIIVPLIESSFIDHSYANRIGYGTHKALKYFIKNYRNYDYVLQCDIRKFFPTIDHEILKEIIRHKIKCHDTLWLIDTIINNSNEQESIIQYFDGDDLLTPLTRKKGLPIGNLTSQFFANFYLNYFDHFIYQKLKINKYVRYVDDFALFANNKNKLTQARLEIESYLSQLRLKIHPIKSKLFSTQYGANFLGFRIFPNKIRVKNQNLHFARRRLKKLQEDYRQGNITIKQVLQSLKSWEAHLNYGDTYQLKKKIFDKLIFRKN